MRRELGMFVALVADVPGALVISNPDFLGQSNVVNTIRQISMLGIFAIGIGVRDHHRRHRPVGRLGGRPDRRASSPRSPSHAPTGGMGYSLWLGIPSALGVALLIGLVQGLLITRLKLQPFIVTLGGMLLSAASRRPSSRAARSASATRRCSTSPTAGCFDARRRSAAAATRC